jgi:hypothetical protein
MAQERARLRFGSRWVSDGVVAGLTKVTAPGRRTRRRPAFCTAPASCSTRTHPPRVATGPAPHVHGRPPVASCRRQCGARLPPPHLHSPSPLRQRTQVEGKNPKWVILARLGSRGPLQGLGQGGAGVNRWPSTPNGGDDRR